MNNEYLDHQQDIANAHLCDTEPQYRYFDFEVIETRYEVTKRYKRFRIDASTFTENETLEEMVGNHLTPDDFYDFINNNGGFIKEEVETLAEDVQEVTGHVWETTL